MRITVLVFFLFALPVYSADTTIGLHEADSTQLTISQEDSVQGAVDSGTTAITVDSSDSLPAATTAPDTLDRSVLVQKNAPAPQPPQAPPRASTRKIRLTKRHFNYKQQVILAVGMMAFIALMMTTAQSWNPK